MRARRSAAGAYLIVIVVALGLGAIGTFVLGRSYSELALQKEPFQRLSYVPSFDPVEDVTLGLPPNATNLVAERPAASIRAIEVYPTQTLLISGGRAVRSINVPEPRTLRRLVRIVRNKSWISEAGTTVTLNAALVVESGSRLTIAAPVTTGLVLRVRPGVFLAATRGHLVLSGVYVRASDSAVPTTKASPSTVAGRPFVLAAENSSMVISHCVFRYLGRDWNSSYGISWSKGSTGSITDSTVEHDFIGVYSNDSRGLQVEHNLLSHNSLYGIDPHSGSSDLLIAYNTADFNGRHGIIFSNDVTDSVVRSNVTRWNGLNGIMMDEASAHNLIVGNTVLDNSSDGIVLANSSDNTVRGNIVRRNRVGINVRGNTQASRLSGNTVTGNLMAAEGANLSGNTAYANGSEWLPARIQEIWLLVLGLMLVLLAVTWVSSRRRFMSVA
jgi:poly(beta-D-mannuronate) C5 epimerase